MKYAIVEYPIKEDLLNSGFISQTNKTARVNNSKNKCIVSYNDAYHNLFRGYPTLPEDELLDYISKNPSDWDNEYVDTVTIANTQQTYAISDNKTDEGKALYTKIHGQKAIVAAGVEHIFSFTVPTEYEEVYFQGAEIMQDIIGVSDFDIHHPVYGVLETYGFDVNLGTIKYMRESKYAAKIPAGLAIRCKYTNDTTEEQEVGVNFLMHEIRSQ